MKFPIMNIELFIVVSMSHVHYSSAQTYALLDGGQYSACPTEHNGKRYRSVPQDSCREAIAWHPGWGGNVPETVRELLRSDYPCGCIINHATMNQIFIYPDIMYNPYCDLYGPTMRKGSIGIVCEEVSKNPHDAFNFRGCCNHWPLLRDLMSIFSSRFSLAKLHLYLRPA